MNIEEIINITEGTLLAGSLDNSRQIKGGCSADLMSDVLASVQPGAVLLTGLCNPQVIRTSQMSDVAAIVFVRGKTPPEQTISLAEEEEIPLISSPYGMFELSGRLYKAGLSSFERTINDD